MVSHIRHLPQRYQNFEVAEEQKRARQFDAYLRKTEPSSTQVDWMEKWNPYNWVKAAPKSVAVESMPSGLVLPLKKAIVQDSRGRRQRSQSSVCYALLRLSPFD